MKRIRLLCFFSFLSFLTLFNHLICMRRAREKVFFCSYSSNAFLIDKARQQAHILAKRLALETGQRIKTLSTNQNFKKAHEDLWASLRVQKEIVVLKINRETVGLGFLLKCFAAWKSSNPILILYSEDPILELCPEQIQPITSSPFRTETIQSVYSIPRNISLSTLFGQEERIYHRLNSLSLLKKIITNKRDISPEERYLWSLANIAKQKNIPMLFRGLCNTLIFLDDLKQVQTASGRVPAELAALIVNFAGIKGLALKRIQFKNFLKATDKKVALRKFNTFKK